MWATVAGIQVTERNQADSNAVIHDFFVANRLPLIAEELLPKHRTCKQ